MLKEEKVEEAREEVREGGTVGGRVVRVEGRGVKGEGDGRKRGVPVRLGGMMPLSIQRRSLYMTQLGTVSKKSARASLNIVCSSALFSGTQLLCVSTNHIAPFHQILPFLVI